MVSFGEAALQHRKTQERAGPHTVCAGCPEHAVPARGSSRAASAGEGQRGLSGSTGCAPQPCQPISPGGAGGSSTKRPPQLLRGSLLELCWSVLCSGTRGCGCERGCQLELLGSVSPAPQAAGRAAARGAALATFLAPSPPAPDLGALQVGERPRADVSQGMLPHLGPGCVSPCPGTARVTATLRPLRLSAKSHPVPFCEIARFLCMGGEGIILPATTKIG